MIKKQPRSYLESRPFTWARVSSSFEITCHSRLREHFDLLCERRDLRLTVGDALLMPVYLGFCCAGLVAIGFYGFAKYFGCLLLCVGGVFAGVFRLSQCRIMRVLDCLDFSVEGEDVGDKGEDSRNGRANQGVEEVDDANFHFRQLLEMAEGHKAYMAQRKKKWEEEEERAAAARSPQLNIQAE